MNAESWYAIWTRSHCERLVEQQLSARGFSPFLPEVPSRRSKDRRSRGAEQRQARANVSGVSLRPRCHDQEALRRYARGARHRARARGRMDALDARSRMRTSTPSSASSNRRRGISASVPASWRPRARRGRAAPRRRRHLRDGQSAERLARCDDRPARPERRARGQRRGRGQVQLPVSGVSVCSVASVICGPSSRSS